MIVGLSLKELHTNVHVESPTIHLHMELDF